MSMYAAVAMVTTCRPRAASLAIVAVICAGCGDSNAINKRPSLAAIPQTVFSVGVPGDVELRATDEEDVNNLRFEIEDSTLVDLPSRSVLLPQGVVRNIAVAVFRWTPTASDVGNHQVKFRVWDPHGNSSAERLYLSVGP